jgi:phosphopentomutase
MGTRPQRGESGPIRPKLAEIRKALEAADYKVRLYPDENETAGVLIVDEGVTIGDNLETDLGDNYNVTAALDIIPFEKVKKIGFLVRSLVRTSRVIVFGGEEVSLGHLLDAYESRDGYAGVNAPRSGVYRKGYQVIHLGFGVNAEVQVPALLARAGIPTALIGKAADIVQNPGGKNFGGVDTGEIFAETLTVLDSMEEGFICVNVQETDLAGHREDPQLYGERLSLSDQGIRRIMDRMCDGDMMVVTADHGNDPCIGHSRHTREKPPILAWSPKLAPGFLGERGSLSDTGATVCDFFRALPPESGVSYFALLKQ